MLISDIVSLTFIAGYTAILLLGLSLITTSWKAYAKTGGPYLFYTMLGFIFITAAALVRAVLTLLSPGSIHPAVLLEAVLFLIAFGLFWLSINR